MHQQNKRWIISLWFFLLILMNPLYAEELFPAQMTVGIRQKPSPLLALNKAYLVYEIHLTNYHIAPATLNSLEVQAGSKTYQFSETDLDKMIKPIGIKGSNTNGLSFLPGQAKIVFMWLPFDNVTLIPPELVHKITLTTTIHDKNTSLNLTTKPLGVIQQLPIIVKPPLKGDYWIAGNAPSNTSDHRRANLVVHGVDYFSQRYAIDFIKMGPDGNSYQGNEYKNESYHCYGKNIYAVAEGTVVALKDGLPENKPHSSKPAVPINMETVGGNYIVIDMGESFYAFYAHMIPGSLQVKLGDKVEVGQVIGKIGNSGNSSEPHLHFHIVDKSSFIAANGIPYGFDSFWVRPGQVLESKRFKVKYLGDEITHYKDQLVLENTIMKFEDEEINPPNTELTPLNEPEPKNLE